MKKESSQLAAITAPPPLQVPLPALYSVPVAGGYVEARMRQLELETAVAKLISTQLSFDATNFDFNGKQIEIWVEITGQIPTTPIGPDPDGDGLEWEYATVDETRIIHVPVSVSVDDLAALISIRILQIQDAIIRGNAESQMIRETELALTDDYNRTR